MTHHARKLVRTLLPVGVAAAMLVLGGTVTPAYADSTPSCTSGVFSGAGDGPLTKTVESVAPTGNTDEYLITYRVTSPRPAGTYRLRDCVFIDAGTPNAYDGETLVGNSDEKDQVFVANTGGGSTTTFQQTVVVHSGEQVCDRAAMSGTDTSTGLGFTDKSNLLCFSPNNPPVVPESSLAVTLPLAAVVAVGGVLYLQRRRRTATPA